MYLKTKKKTVTFGAGIGFVTVLTFLSILPGIDLLAWHQMKPVGFYQEALFLLGAAVTFGPMFWVASAVSIAVTCVLVAFAE